MTTIFIILVVLASVILALIVLVQNPKGGGLAGSIGGFSNQLMGVKQTTDVLEKGTWLFGGVVAALCLLSVVFIPKEGTASSTGPDATNATAPSAPKTMPVNSVNMNPGGATTPATTPTTTPTTPAGGGK
ncbi:MAG: preprotein translocase subunit SecG [Chitinophagaceae bacterium]|nr:preprotein translocase subunit SecG [Chitinophagaceae bacterium]MBL0334217.1 preprotein translocase subunit SecG [Chitinophagaceae bacterium]